MKRLSVTKVNEGTCKAIGLRVEDILDSFEGIALDSSEALSSAMTAHSGKTGILKYVRNSTFMESHLIAGPLGIFVEPIEVDWTALLLARDMQVSTTPTIPGFQIKQSLDIVSAECVFGMNIFKDIFASFSDIFGGRSNTTQNVLRDARRTCLNELRLEAAKVGANGVVGIDLDYSEISGGGKSMLFLVATGTAVRIEAL